MFTDLCEEPFMPVLCHLFAFKCLAPFRCFVSPDKIGFTCLPHPCSVLLPSHPKTIPPNLSRSNLGILGNCLICWDLSLHLSSKDSSLYPTGLHKCLLRRRWSANDSFCSVVTLFCRLLLRITTIIFFIRICLLHK